jgi:hypothetical protein
MIRRLLLIRNIHRLKEPPLPIKSLDESIERRHILNKSILLVVFRQLWHRAEDVHVYSPRRFQRSVVFGEMLLDQACEVIGCLSSAVGAEFDVAIVELCDVDLSALKSHIPNLDDNLPVSILHLTAPVLLVSATALPKTVLSPAYHNKRISSLKFSISMIPMSHHTQQKPTKIS